MSTLSVDTIQGKTTAGTVAMPAGMVIQVVEGTLNSNSQFSTSSTTLADTGLTVQITPKFSSSKILVLLQGFGGADANNTALKVQVQRDIGGGGYNMITGGGFWYPTNSYNSIGLNKLDSPNTTSQITYKVQGHLSQASGTAYLPGNWASSYTALGFVTLTAQEIKQ